MVIGIGGNMANQEYFNRALLDFAFEVACKDAIRHLADAGYTIEQIMRQLTFPASYEQVQKTVWEHFLDKRVILLEEPGKGAFREKPIFVREYDAYGRASFRKIASTETGPRTILWKEEYYSRHEQGDFGIFLEAAADRNGGEKAYVSCDFGVWKEKDEDWLKRRLEVLEKPHQEYILGLPWENKVVYHQLDKRMRKIVVRLYEKEHYPGICFFLHTEEKLIYGG